MDKVLEKGKATAVAGSWAWLPTRMPGVASLVREKRLLWGDAHVDRCWQRGVIQGQPGWFFAREGSVSVGTPWGKDDPGLLALLEAHHQQGGAPMLMMAKPGAEG